jgi:hypothetical protein
LLRIRSRAENDAVTAAATAQLPADPGVMFLGATDRDVEGQFRWLDGDALFTPGYSPWEGNAPVGGTAENCLELGLETNEDGSWNDCDCADAQAFVCSLPANAEIASCTNVDVEGRRFAICPTPSDHAAAAAACAGTGGTLARIDDKAQQDAVVTAAKALVTIDAFLGGSDAATEDVWTWPDGTVFDDLRR